LISVILDEGLNDPPGALAVVDDAITALGSTPALVRQKAKVLVIRETISQRPGS
jgi:hypothetical protein